LNSKQANLTFSNPFLNTSNTISLKYNSTLFNIDSSGNLSLVTSYLPLAGGTISGTLNITGKTSPTDLQVRGILTLPVNNWIIDSNTNLTSNQRIYFDNGAKTYFRSCGTSASPSLDGFVLRNGPGTDLLTIDGNGAAVLLSTLIVGNNNSYPYLQLGSTNGHNLAVATTAGSFSTSSLAGDLVLRSINRLLLQSGSSGYGLLIDSSNNIFTNGKITTSNSIITNSINNSLISYVYPTPYNNGSTSANQTNSYTNLCVSTTAGFGVVFPYLSVVCSDIANNFGTKIYLSSAGTYWTGYNFNTRIILDSTYTTNSVFPTGGSLFFQTSDTNNVNANTI